MILMLLFAVSIGYATFIENDYGTLAARALIFSSWWLEMILVFLCVIFIYNIYRFRLLHINKLPVLFLHCSFIFIIIGAAITRYIGNEGVMRIREGSMNNQFLSSDSFLEFKIHNNLQEINGEKCLILSSISNNQFKIPINFNDDKILIEYVDFIHDPVETIFIDEDHFGSEVLELVSPSKSGGMQSNFIKINSINKIDDLNIGFNVDQPIDIQITKLDSVFYFLSEYDVHYMRMSDQHKGVLKKSNLHPFSKKTLYTINGKNIVFKEYYKSASISEISKNIKNDDNEADLLKLKLSVNNADTLIDLSGHKGIVSPKTYFYFNNLFFSISYGSKNFNLPFAIYLKSFELDRYPGSNSPSSFASNIEVWDNEKKIDYRIFMNNVLSYRGYRFFQSSYDKDEKGTILSVNQDKWGTIITYFGYLCLLISVLTLILSRFSRFNILSRVKNK